MHRILFTLLSGLFALPLGAQHLSIDFTKDPDEPIAIDNPAAGKTLFFVYPNKLVSAAFAPKGNPWKAYEMDSRTLQVLRTGEGNNLLIRESVDLDFRPLCRFSRGQDYYIAAENDNTCRIYRISGENLSLSVADSFTVEKGERIINGVSDASGAYILCSGRSKKEGRRLTVYEIGEGGRLLKHDFPEPVKHSQVFEAALKKNFKPRSVQYGIEEEPERASAKTKLFAGPRKLWITFDDGEVGTTYSNPAAILRVLTLNLDVDTFSVRAYYYTDSLVRDATRERRNSYIFENRVFQLYMNDEQLLVRVRDLESGNVLFTQSALRDDSIGGFANSPIRVAGRGLFGVEKEYSSVRKFMRRFAKFDPFLQVRRAGASYILCMGGFEEINNPGSMNAFNTATGAWSPGGFGYSYENSFSFYLAVDDPDMKRSTVFYKKPLIDAYAEMLEKLKKPRQPALYNLGGAFYLGYHDRGERQYRFARIENY